MNLVCLYFINVRIGARLATCTRCELVVPDPTRLRNGRRSCPALPPALLPAAEAAYSRLRGCEPDCRLAAAMGNTPPAPASHPNEVSLMVNDPGCCGAHYSVQSRVPDPRLLAFVTADEYAKKLEALDEMFVAQRSRVRLLEKLKRYRRVVALVFLTLLTSTITGIVTSVMFAQDQNDWKCAEKEGECSNAIDAHENSCCNFWCCSSQYRDNITDAAELLGADAYEHSSWKPYAYVGFQSVSQGGLSRRGSTACATTARFEKEAAGRRKERGRTRVASLTRSSTAASRSRVTTCLRTRVSTVACCTSRARSYVRKESIGRITFSFRCSS